MNELKTHLVPPSPHSETKIPRMESIPKAAEILGVPVHFVRAKVTSGEVVAVKAGRRYLVNVDKFIEYLNSNTIQTESKPNVSGSICPIY